MKQIEVIAQRRDQLPRLAWVARWDTVSESVTLTHGRDVEVGPNYLVEGVWDGPFQEMGFAASGNFFGSGMLISKDAITFVPSRALVDRLLLCESESCLYASNSLPLLLGSSGARLDPHHNYDRESYTSLRGISQYARDFHLSHPNSSIRAEQLYHAPLKVAIGGRRQRLADANVPSFTSFEEYHSYLRDVLAAIADNATSPERTRPLNLRTTTSSGYDSSAVTALVRELGVRITYTRRRSNSTLPAWLQPSAVDDDGAPVAGRLGYEVRDLEPPTTVRADHELYHLAATTAEPEVALHSLAVALEAEELPTVLFTGYHGDKVWDRRTSGRYLSADLIRGDTSGLNLGEIRLLAGYVNLAVPFVGARAIRDVVTIANGPAMRPWQIGTGYDRPIPRRIVESEGVPRSAFGVRKKAVVQTYMYPWNGELRERFFVWLEFTKGISRHRARLSRYVNDLLFLGRRLVQKVLRALGKRPPDPVSRFGVASDLPQLLHIWAVETLSEVYRKQANGTPQDP